MAAKPKFTRIPKVSDLTYAGVPTEVIPTYCVLADYSNNKMGLCWPKMETLAKTLGRSVRTIQRHLHLLKELGLVDFIERRRNRRRFSSYLYRVVHFVELIRRKKGLQPPDISVGLKKEVLYLTELNRSITPPIGNCPIGGGRI